MKLLTCVQSLWFLITYFDRVIQQLLFSTFKVFIISFIECIWFNYYFWWHKSQSLKTIIFIHVSHLLEYNLNAMKKIMSLSRKDEWKNFIFHSLSNVKNNFWQERTAIEQMMCRSLQVIKLMNMNSLSLKLDRDLLKWENLMNDAMLNHWKESLQLTCTIFSDILHSVFNIVVWNFVFSTLIKSLLWKISICATMRFALVMMIYTLVDWFMINKKNCQQLNFINFKCYVMIFFFLRLYIIMKTFIDLRSLSAKIFCTVIWFKYISHIF